MTAFDPERNVDKFLQDSVLADIPVHSLDLLREQKKLYEEARIMFENIKTRKTVLDQIEETTKEYERQLKTKTLRSMMFEYQYINKNKIEINNKNIELENLKIEKINLAKTREEAASNLEKARKLLSDAEGKNANVKASLEKLEEEQRTSGSDPSLFAPSAQVSMFDLSGDAFIEEVAAIDPDQLTPKNALDRLYALVARARKLRYE